MRAFGLRKGFRYPIPKTGLLTVLGLLIILSGPACDREREFHKGFRSADKNYMNILTQELESAGMSYWLDKSGYIRYSPKDETRFNEIKAMVTAMVSGKWGFSPPAGDIDHDFLKALKEELDSAGVEYSIDEEAAVRFVRGDKQKFKSILLKTDKMYHLGDAAIIFNEEKRQRLIRLLEEKGIEHIVLATKDDVVVRWYPENETQRDEIWDEVNSLGCGNKRDKKIEKKKVLRPNETSKTVLMQQWCSS